jgi:hypothetical protein
MLRAPFSERFTLFEKGCNAPGGDEGGDPVAVYTNWKYWFVDGSIHHPAYLSTAVTSSSEAGLCGVSGVGDFGGIGVGLCRISYIDFRENLFHALR